MAKAWLNSAIATASLLADPVDRAFQGAFYKNGLALVEVNLGDPSEALRLVNDCVSSLDRQLGPDEHRLHRSVLKNNRARVYASLGRLQECLHDYAVVIAEDPNHAEHYLERGNVLRRLGRFDEASADYETAIRLSPPVPGDLLQPGRPAALTGDMEGALADFSYVSSSNPTSSMPMPIGPGSSSSSGDLDGAAAGRRRPGWPGTATTPICSPWPARCTPPARSTPQARWAYDRAVESAPDLVAAWSARAELACELGDFDAAIADLDRAVDLQPEDASLRYNRAFAHQRTGSWAAALPIWTWRPAGARRRGHRRRPP